VVDAVWALEVRGYRALRTARDMAAKRTDIVVMSKPREAMLIRAR
jgi:hypothetical protein